MKTLKKIIKQNCQVLGIDAPALRVEKASFFTTETTRAALVADEGRTSGACIVVNERFIDELKKDEVQAVLTLSHECRHHWQIVRLSLGGYSSSEKMSVEEYNAQDLEVDAWAWATIATSYFFKKTPDFKSVFGDALAKKIMDRASEILEKKII